MRFFSIAIVFAVVGAISTVALPIPLKELSVDLDARTPEPTEPGPATPGPATPATPAKNWHGQVDLSGAAHSHLDSLGLHGEDRKTVENWHIDEVKKAMAEKGADSARINHLLHSQGSVDLRPHITAGLWDPSNKRIPTTFGDPPRKGNVHHIIPTTAPPKEYVDAVTKAGKTI